MIKRFAPLAFVVVALTGCPETSPGGPPNPIPRTATDLDGDGISNAADTDVDGDHVANAVDPDIDGDGTINDEDDDADGDGDANATDTTDRGAGDQIGPHGDVDADGEANHTDTDDDGDGIPDNVTNDGNMAGENSDADGYCFDPEGGYSACDDGAEPGSGGADGTTSDDLDGDGIPDDQDPDRDGDGEVNVTDPSPDGTFDPPADDEPPTDPTDPGPGSPPVCQDEVFNNSVENPRILLVVDRSGSMDQDADGYNGTKWQGAKAALSEVVTALDADISFGLMMYPAGSSNDEVCEEGGLEVAVAAQNADNIIDSLNDTAPAGGTPTAPTLLAAKAVLDGMPAVGGKRVVVVATDGAPNCNMSLDLDTCTCTNPNGCDNVQNCLDDQGSYDAAVALNQAGYPLFVVGITGSEGFAYVLNGMAQAGGTAIAGATQYYDASSADNLAASLESVAVRVGSCRFDLANPTTGSSDITVTSNGSTIARDPSRTIGWDLVDQDTIEVFGGACASVVNSTSSVTVHYCTPAP